MVTTVGFSLIELMVVIAIVGLDDIITTLSYYDILDNDNGVAMGSDTITIPGWYNLCNNSACDNVQDGYLAVAGSFLNNASCD